MTPSALVPSLRWAAPAVWMVLVSYLSHRSHPPGSGAIDWLSALLWGQGDKVFHAGEFAVLALLLTLAVPPSARSTRGALAVLGTCALFAAADEVHQAFIPRRAGSPVDWLADMAGAALVVALLIPAWGWVGRMLGHLSHAGRL